jgi:hypothetical protein
MFFFRRIIKQLLITTLIGFVIRKLMASSNPRAKQVGHQANRVVGGIVGLDETGHRASRRRRATKSAGTALIGGAMSYFFDPQQGYDRRQRVKTFASDQVARRRSTPPALPAAATIGAPVGTSQTANATT